jgi:general secretion pathway protein I
MSESSIINHQPSIANGFTLIEVVAALAIVSIALLGLLKLHLISMQTADSAQVMNQAVLLAQEKMTEALCDGYPQAGTRSGVAEADGARFTWRTEVTDARSFSPRGLDLNLRGLRKLLVDVAWQRGSGEKHIQMATYMADNRVHE